MYRRRSTSGNVFKNAVEPATVVEVIVLRLFPATEHLVDTEQLDIDELVGKLPGDLPVAGAVVVLGRQALGLVAIQMLKVGFSYSAGTLALDVLVDHGHRRLSQDTDRGHDDLELPFAQLLDRQISLVFPGDEYITQAALDESVSGASGAWLEYRHVGEQLTDELVSLVLIAAVLLQGITPGREIVPACTTGGFRVGSDDLHVIAHQVIPVLDVFRVTLAH